MHSWYSLSLSCYLFHFESRNQSNTTILQYSSLKKTGTESGRTHPLCHCHGGEEAVSCGCGCEPSNDYSEVSEGRFRCGEASFFVL